MGEIIDLGLRKILNEMDTWEDDFIKFFESNKAFIFGGHDKMHIFGIFRLLYLNLRWLESSVEIIKSSGVLRDLIGNKGGKKFILDWLRDIIQEVENIK